MLNLPLALGGLTGWGGSGCCPPTRHHSRPGPRGWRGSQRPCTRSCSSSLPFRFPRLPFIISHLRLISLGLFPSLLSQSLPFSFFPSRAPCPNVRERAHILPSTPCARCALALVSCPNTMFQSPTVLGALTRFQACGPGAGGCSTQPRGAVGGAVQVCVDCTALTIVIQQF